MTDGIADVSPATRADDHARRKCAEAHPRAERGTRCYQAGRCRLPSSYLYDKEIIPRVKTAILADGRFAGTSVWALGQRRWVILKGCVRTETERKALEGLVRAIDDVEAVVNELVVTNRKRARRLRSGRRAGIIARPHSSHPAVEVTPASASRKSMRPFNPAEIEAAVQSEWRAADAYRAVEARRPARSSTACRCCPIPRASCTWGTCATTRSTT